MNDSQVYLIKDIKNGGSYHFENMLCVCIDCYKILNSNDLVETIKYLNFTDSLMNKVSSK